MGAGEVLTPMSKFSIVVCYSQQEVIPTIIFLSDKRNSKQWLSYLSMGPRIISYLMFNTNT